MKLVLIAEDSEFSIPIPPRVAAAVAQQLERVQESDDERRRFADACIRLFPGLITKALADDIRPPSERQVAFAVGLAKRLKIGIPGDVLINRDAMCDFLDKYTKDK